MIRLVGRSVNSVTLSNGTYREYTSTLYTENRYVIKWSRSCSISSVSTHYLAK
jgi:hypothetical protein